MFVSSFVLTQLLFSCDRQSSEKKLTRHTTKAQLKGFTRFLLGCRWHVTESYGMDRMLLFLFLGLTFCGLPLLLSAFSLSDSFG